MSVTTKVCLQTNKRIFADKWAAYAELKRIHRVTSREETHHYECHHCNGWHLTSKKQWGQ